MANVVSVSNSTVRGLLEEFTSIYTYPDLVQFIQDGNLLWVTSVENIQNIKYSGIKGDINTFLNERGVVTTVTSLREALETYGAIIVYVPPRK